MYWFRPGGAPGRSPHVAYQGDPALAVAVDEDGCIRVLRTIQRYTQTFDYAWRAAILREASSYYGSDAEGKKVLAAEHRSWRRRAVERQARPSRQPARAPSFRLLPAERQLPAE